jgi:hypothetical protein
MEYNNRNIKQNQLRITFNVPVLSSPSAKGMQPNGAGQVEVRHLTSTMA